MKPNHKWQEKMADYSEMLVASFVLGSLCAAFIAPIIFLWFAARWWLQ